MDTLKALQTWFLAQCNGSWEHQHGIKIETLDNPGWSIEIDLCGTKLQDKVFPAVQNLYSENKWVNCIVKNGKFFGTCGPGQLGELIKIFIVWTNEKI